MSKPKNCKDCFSCKTITFRDPEAFLDWLNSKNLMCSMARKNEIINTIKRRKNKGTAIYFCSNHNNGPYLKISQIPRGRCNA